MDIVSLIAAKAGQARAGERSGFAGLPAMVQLGVGLVAAAGAAATGAGLLALPLDRWPTLLGLLGLCLLSGALRVPVPLNRGGAGLSWGYIANVLSVVLVGAWPSVPVAVIGAWGASALRNRDTRSWYRTVFTLGSTALGVLASGLVYEGSAGLLPAQYWADFISAMFGATAYFMVTTGLVGLVMAASTEGATRVAIEERLLASAPAYYAGAGLAVMAAEIVTGGPYWWAVAFALPGYLAYRSYRAHADRLSAEHAEVREMCNVHLSVVKALAKAIEAKDSTTPEQVERIQVYSEGLARALSMNEAEVQAVKTAALLHDVGNLAVPDHILSKPGRLTYEEYESLKKHPVVGANIISQVPFPYPVAPLVLSHHERWDGRGYPKGLRGDAIPLGARILSVVDCFTSMLTERPYRPSHTYAEAIATLRENRGSTLDPDLVEKFIEILPAIEAQMHQSQAASKGAPGAPAHGGAATALADIVVARREDQILREMGQSLSASLQVSDALSLISTKLVSVMPLDACALFRHEPTSGLFMCSHVVGSHQDAIRSVTAATVEGLGGALPTSSASVLGAPSRLQSLSVAPLVTDAGTIGALAVYHVDRNVYTSDDRRLLARVASHAANVIASAIVFEQTQEQSLTDVLTGLPNRRYLDSHLAQEIARVRRHGGQLSVLVLDMDGFKQINDEFGHQAGDGALREVSQVLRGSLRVYDVCARFAGDEFVLVLGDCDPAQAERRRADLQRAIAAIWVEPIPGRIVSLSVSVGAATFPDDADTVDGVLSVADRRMYRDKGERKRLGPGHATPTPDCLWH
ncbi:MAG: diguanylate cyclase [Vicinamibacterales bacterium]